MKKILLFMIALLSSALFTSDFLRATSHTDEKTSQFNENYLIDNIINTSKTLMTNKISEIYNNDMYETLRSTNNENEITELSELSDEIFDVLSGGDTELAWSLLFENLSTEELMLLSAIFESSFDSYHSDDELKDSRFLRRGYLHIHLYVHFSQGWFWGEMSATLITAAIVPVVAKKMAWGALKAGVAGVIVGGLIGATIGVEIRNTINNLVYRGGQAGFTRDLINARPINNALWFPPRITIRQNLLDILFSIINFSGGNFTPGSTPALGPQLVIVR